MWKYSNWSADGDLGSYLDDIEFEDFTANETASSSADAPAQRQCAALLSFAINTTRSTLRQCSEEHEDVFELDVVQVRDNPTPARAQPTN